MSFRIEPLFPNYEDGNWDFISGNPFSTIEIEKLIAKIICVKHCFSSPGLALLLDREKKKTEPSRDWILSFIDGCVSTLNVCKTALLWLMAFCFLFLYHEVFHRSQLR